MPFLRGFVRLVRRLALAGAAGAAAIGVLLGRGGFSSLDAVVVAVLLAPAAILLVFAQGFTELAALPDRLRRMPREGQERLTELSRLAGQARTTRARGMPLLLWRLRSTVGSVGDIAGVALPLRVLTPGFLALAGFAAVACVGLAGAGLIALLALVLG